MGNKQKSSLNKNTTPPVYVDEVQQNYFNNDEAVEKQNYNQNRIPQNEGTMKLLNDKEEDKNKKIVAVIVTLNSGGSYDDLFRNVEQKSI